MDENRTDRGESILIQLLTPNHARTEALLRSIKKARIGAYRLGAYGTLTAHLRGVNPHWGDPPR
jgi:hypothetical protein